MAHRAGTLAALKSAPAIPAYLVLLRVGFTMRRSLLNVRCALTAPFHPYLRCRRRYIFCCTGRLCALKRKSRTLSGTLPCGVRTFLPLPRLRVGGSDHPAACNAIVTWAGALRTEWELQENQDSGCTGLKPG